MLCELRDFGAAHIGIRPFAGTKESIGCTIREGNDGTGEVFLRELLP